MNEGRQSIRRAGVNQKKLLAFFSASIALVFMYALGIILAGNGVELMLFGMAGSSMLIVMIPALTRRDYFIFEPMSFVFISVLFGLGLKTFYVVLGYSTNFVVYDGLMKNLAIEDLQAGSAVLLLGLTAFVFGYHIKLPRAKMVKILTNYQLSRNRVGVFSLIFVLISLAAFVGFASSIGFSYHGIGDLSQKRFQSVDYTASTRLETASYYLYRLSLICKAPMYVLFFLILKNKIPYRSFYGLLFLICLLLNVFVPFFVSNKAGIILVVADLFVLAYGVQRKFNYLKVFIVSALAVLILAFVIDIRGGEALSDYTIFDKLFGGRYFVGLTKTAHIVGAFPNQLEYFHGATLVGWMNIFLPTEYSFSPDAFNNLEYFLGYYVFDMRANGIPPGIIAEFYLNFGIAGVAIGMMIVGAFLYWIHASMYPYLEEGAVLIIYAIVIVRVPTFLFNNGVSVALLKTAADVLIVIVFLFLVGSFRKKRGRH